MSTATELYGIDDEAYEKILKELETKTVGKKRKEALIEMINELSTAKRDQREIVVLAVMMGMITRGR
jgi:pyruvate-formate lyase